MRTDAQTTVIYHEAFRTPGISPESASSRKQIRQMPNFLRKARDLPQRWQRLCCRTSNFGFRLLFSIMALRAIYVSLYQKGCTDSRYDCTMMGLSSPRNGMPSSRRSASAMSSLFVVVTNVMSIPWICSTMS